MTDDMREIPDHEMAFPQYTSRTGITRVGLPGPVVALGWALVLLVAAVFVYVLVAGSGPEQATSTPSPGTEVSVR